MQLNPKREAMRATSTLEAIKAEHKTHEERRRLASQYNDVASHMIEKDKN